MSKTPSAAPALDHLHFLDTDRDLTRQDVGGKGYYLIQMTRDALPVPFAGVLDTHLWKAWRKDPKGIEAQLRDTLVPRLIERLKDANGGALPRVSVRSAGAVSMPGMMDTILNVGITQGSMSAAIEAAGTNKAGEERFQADCYARFLQMYGDSVLGIAKEKLAPIRAVLDDAPSAAPPKGKGAKSAPGGPYGLIARVHAAAEDVYKRAGHALPAQKPEDQILQSILAVFRSWDSERAKLYRDMNGIDQEAGTAVVVQTMIYGNRNDNSATGVVFSRNPGTGAPGLMGEYLIGAQGEDVVSGSHTPDPIAHLEQDLPEVHRQLNQIAHRLERTYRQIQDIEFTVEDGTLYILQARTARCAPFAHLKVLMAMHAAQEISSADVLESFTLKEYLDLNVRQVDPAWTAPPAATGLSGSLGALQGRVVFGPSAKYAPEATIFVAQETTPDDLQAIRDASGVLTARGGVTSHAAVVARGMGKVCVVGCEAITFTKDASGDIRSASIGGQEVRSGDWITLDAGTGRVWVGKEVPILDAKNEDVFVALEDLVMDAHPDWVRATSSIDELRRGHRSVLATYALDDAPIDTLRTDLTDAVEFLTGTIDLTGRLDSLSASHPDLFLCADQVASQVFQRKKETLIEVLSGLDGSIADLVDFDVYLGPYEAEHASDFRALGVRVRAASEFDLSSVQHGHGVKSSPDSLKVRRAPDASVPANRLVISSRNALLSLLK